MQIIALRMIFSTIRVWKRLYNKKLTRKFTIVVCLYMIRGQRCARLCREREHDILTKQQMGSVRFTNEPRFTIENDSMRLQTWENQAPGTRHNQANIDERHTDVMTLWFEYVLNNQVHVPVWLAIISFWWVIMLEVIELCLSRIILQVAIWCELNDQFGLCNLIQLSIYRSTLSEIWLVLSSIIIWTGTKITPCLITPFAFLLTWLTALKIDAANAI